ncbi:MAG: Arc family DNA-binding protein [Hylemonella sp.]|nr:Arc family DNA-binding protein [Hylemonella sp.]
MPHLSIKDVPAAWAEALRQRALQHHRSLQGELMAILEQVLTQPPSSPAPAGPVAGPGLDRTGRPVLRQGSKTLAQVRQELLARYPQAITAQASSVALIREGRESR